MRHSLLAILLIATAALAGCAGRQADYSQGITAGERIFFGKVAYKRARDTDEDKGVLEKMGIAPDEWHLDRIGICFNDGREKDICTIHPERDIRMGLYEKGETPGFSFRSAGKSLKLTRVLAFGRSDKYVFRLTKAPVISAPADGAYYIGDIIISLPKEKRGAEMQKRGMWAVPGLELTVTDRLEDGGKGFAQSAKLGSGARMEKRLFPNATPEYVMASEHKTTTTVTIPDFR